MALKRISKEYEQFLEMKDKYSEYSDISIKSDNLVWLVSIRTKKDGIYKGQPVMIEVTFPKDYPFSQPIFKIISNIIHPNIVNGFICSNKDYSMALTTYHSLLIIKCLLDEPDFDNVLDPSAVKYWKSHY